MFEQFTSSVGEHLDHIIASDTTDMFASSQVMSCCLFTLLLCTVYAAAEAGRPLQLCDPGYTPNEESTHLLQSNSPGVVDATDRPGQSDFLQGERDCPQNIQVNQSTCPTYFSLNFDPNREPPTIAEVMCACENCRYETGESSNACVPIYYHRNVLEREPRDDCYRWRVRAFKVGCECMGASTEDMASTRAQE